MKCEIIDHGDYIEFSKPLDGICNRIKKLKQ